MKKVIVTGANGFIGSSLIQILIKRQIKVIAIDVSFNNSFLPISDLITKYEMGLDDIEKLKRKICNDKFDVFFHFAWKGVNGVEKTDPFVQFNNVKIALNCVNLAKAIGCKKFLCAGTIAEEAVRSLTKLEKTNNGMMYGIAKHCTHLLVETYCKNIDLEFIWMQFSNIYGPHNKTGNLVSYTIQTILSGNEASFGPALQPYDFIFVDDLLEAIFRLGNCTTTKNFYFLGSGKPRILKDYLFEIGRICNKESFIKIDERPDDGIVYTMDMFDTSSLVEDIGEYVSKSFSEGIKYTLENL